MTNAQVCFVGGTSIRVKRDGAEVDVAVEHLEIGDLAVCATGDVRAVRWLGHRTTDCRQHPRPNEAYPIRISAHAFAAERPARDLFVSPGHAICVDILGEVLIPAGALVNGSTIQQVEVDEVTYWHVELDCHDILLAENLPAESYLEMGNRSFFGNADVVALVASPDGPAVTHADFCRPFHAEGPLVAFVRERLFSRATQLGWTLEPNPYAGLHLVVDGRRVEPEVRDLSACFLLPGQAKTVWLVSETGVPAQVYGGLDVRSLGVCVSQIVVEDGFGSRAIAADDPRLCIGFHDIEQGPHRWTAGRARLPSDLWDTCRGAFFLRVDMRSSALPRWAEPATGHERIALAG